MVTLTLQQIQEQLQKLNIKEISEGDYLNHNSKNLNEFLDKCKDDKYIKNITLINKEERECILKCLEESDDGL